MRTLPLLLIVTGFTFGLVAAEPAWRASTWGMSNEEILQAFKAEAHKLATPEKFKDGIAYVGINDLKINDTPFQVRFIMDPQSRLKEVILRVADSVQFPGTRFAELDELLTLKYGKPAYSNDRIENDRRLGNVVILSDTVKKRVWKQQSTTIELTYTAMPELKVRILTICYQQIPDDANKL
jgi:hypothetical protein